MFVKPKPGLKVRDPFTKQNIPEEGREVPELGPDATFWHRLISYGDVVRVESPIPDSAPETGTRAEEK